MALPLAVAACARGSNSAVGGGTSSGTGGSTVTSAGTGGQGSCAPGAAASCYTGPSGTLGVGLCTAGVQTCKPDGSGWGSCEGEVTPVPETCATPGDDDCNGQTNESGPGCVCTPGAVSACYSGPPQTEGVGPCHGGTQTCNDQGTGYGSCTGEVTPKEESCLTPVDDNCNGEVNENGAGCVCTPGAVIPCYTGPAGTEGVGACHGGTQTCNDQGTAYADCAGEVTPVPETCATPIDDNCNGQVNESGSDCVCVPGSSVSCYDGPPGTAGVGACKAGTQVCVALGTGYGPCLGEVLPTPETCYTAADDDCDGVANDHGAGCVCPPAVMTPCYDGPPGTEGVGACAAGIATCNDLGTAYGPCVGEVLPAPETCLTAADDDCDGIANDHGAGCVCLPGVVTPCYDGPAGTEGVGLCVGGARTCNALGTAYGPCVGEILPVPEICATPGDDNCNGVANEPSAGCVCVPDGQLSCYTGPAGTAGVGTCHTGVQTCNVTGTAYGPCLSEVVPRCDDCTTAADEDCDGKPSTCTGGKDFWAKLIAGIPGSYPNQEMYAVAADAAGNVLLAGRFNGSIDLGAGPITSAHMGDAFVAKLDPTGQSLWTRTFGEGEASSVAVDAAGNVVVTGQISGVVDLGGGPRGGGTAEGFVLKLDPAGNHLWSKAFGAQSGKGERVAVDPSGNVVMTGEFDKPTDFGGGPVTSPGVGAVFVVELDPAGSYRWSKGFGDITSSVHGLAADGAGNVLIAGDLYGTGTVDFGGGPLAGAGDLDIFVVELDASGNHVWSKSFGDPAAQVVYDLRTDAAGNVIFTGGFGGNLDLGGGPLAPFPIVGTLNLFLAELDPTGQHLWSKGYFNSQGGSVAVDGAGNVALAGWFIASTDLGAGAVAPGPLGNNDSFVARYDSSGASLWAASYDGKNFAQTTTAIAADPAGNLLVAGTFWGDLGVCTGAVSGWQSGFLFKAGP